MKQVGWLISKDGVVCADAFAPLNTPIAKRHRDAGYSAQPIFVETDEDRFTDPQGTVWTRPTAWDYYAACRSANFWRDQREAIRTILDQRVPEDAPATSPLHCQHCGGNGKDPLRSTWETPHQCGFCGGSGNAADVSPDPRAIPIPKRTDVEQCPDCTGTGYSRGSVPRHATIAPVCDTCHGNGFVKIKQEKMTHG